jgi:hypothetical protein
VQQAAASLGVQLAVVRANVESDFDAAFSTLAQQRAIALNGIISAMQSRGQPNPFGRDPDPNIAAALRMGH